MDVLVLAKNVKMFPEPYSTGCKRDNSKVRILVGIKHKNGEGVSMWYVLGWFYCAVNWEAIQHQVALHFPAGLEPLGMMIDSEDFHPNTDKDLACKKILTPLLADQCNETPNSLCVVFKFESDSDKDGILDGRLVELSPLKVNHLVVKLQNTKEWMTKELVLVNLTACIAKEVESQTKKGSAEIIPFENMHLLVVSPNGTILCNKEGKSLDSPLSSISCARDSSAPKGGLSLPHFASVQCSLLQAVTVDKGEERPFCPILKYNPTKVKWTRVRFSLKCLGLFHKSAILAELQQGMLKSVAIQLQESMRIGREQGVGSMSVLHFPVPCQLVPISLISSSGASDDNAKLQRSALHAMFGLPMDRPFFRTSNLHHDTDTGPYLLNPHEGLPRLAIPGETALVHGWYTYHHYMQDKFDDNVWGCAYRSLQTLCSWFQFQGYTDKAVPTHREIQEALVAVGDKEQSFVGSKQWIGSFEVSICLNQFCGITSKILNVSSGSEMGTIGRQLLKHFQEEGTPIMIGGGVLAHTILGVHYSQTTGEIQFLILDPHYTGGEDLKTVLNKGWCGWKNVEFWDQQAYYNLCMPQRPRDII